MATRRAQNLGSGLAERVERAAQRGGSSEKAPAVVIRHAWESVEYPAEYDAQRVRRGLGRPAPARLSR
jgi:hypothetical protein